MGFRNLISFEEIAEKDSHFLDIDEKPCWEAVFGNSNPLKLEIGFGQGRFLVEMALREPGSNFLGMDFYHKGIRKAVTRIQRNQLENVRIIYGDAKNKMAVLFDDGELTDVYIHFPDPWPKKRHHKRRLIKPDFVNLLGRKVQPGGRVFLATDHEPYALEILDFFAMEPLLENRAPSGGFLEKRWENIPLSKYERNFLNAGEKVFYFEFLRRTE